MSKRYENLRKRMEKQQYAFAGTHSAIKICEWTKKSMRGEGACYKSTFYGIESHRCVQMTPTVGACQNACCFCWRELTFKPEIETEVLDEPEDIVRESLVQQQKMLTGFGGNDKVTKEKLLESKEPKHFAISLTGDPVIYPKLNEMIDEIHKSGSTTYLVTNGLLPERLEKLNPPTQLYISVDAPNKELMLKIDRPAYKDGWERLVKTLHIVRDLGKKTRTVLRLTFINGMNMVNPEQWATLISIAQPKFVEMKGYSFLGASQLRMKREHVPTYEQVKAFGAEVGKLCGYQFLDEHVPSRVVLYGKEHYKDRFLPNSPQAKMIEEMHSDK